VHHSDNKIDSSNRKEYSIASIHSLIISSFQGSASGSLNTNWEDPPAAATMKDDRGQKRHVREISIAGSDELNEDNAAIFSSMQAYERSSVGSVEDILTALEEEFSSIIPPDAILLLGEQHSQQNELFEHAVHSELLPDDLAENEMLSDLLNGTSDGSVDLTSLDDGWSSIIPPTDGATEEYQDEIFEPAALHTVPSDDLAENETNAILVGRAPAEILQSTRNNEDQEDDFLSAASKEEESEQVTPEEMDVLCGRGHPFTNHQGNKRMRNIIQLYTDEYRQVRKPGKTKIIFQVIEAIQCNGARFLFPTENTYEGPYVKASPGRVRKKISAGFRDANKGAKKRENASSDAPGGNLPNESQEGETQQTHVVASRVASKTIKCESSFTTNPTARIDDSSENSSDLVEQGLVPVFATAQPIHAMSSEELQPNAPWINFVSAQRRERKMTRWLVALLVVALAAIVGMVVLLMSGDVASTDHNPTSNDNYTDPPTSSAGAPVKTSSSPTVTPVEPEPPDFDFDDVLASVPETICMERIPGQGWTPLGQGWTSLCTPEDTADQGGGSCNVVARGFLDQVLSADISIQNSGACRSDIAAGAFTYEDAFVLLPYSNLLITLELTGREIVLVLEQALNSIAVNNSTGEYPYAAGLRYDVNLAESFMSRIHNVEINERFANDEWRPMELDQTFTVVANSYMVTSADSSYFALADVPDELKTDTGEDATKTFAVYAYYQGTLLDPVRSEYSTQNAYIPLKYTFPP
jgi:hypothetical protein